jgi:hypothetical protein
LERIKELFGISYFAVEVVSKSLIVQFLLGLLLGIVILIVGIFGDSLGSWSGVYIFLAAIDFTALAEILFSIIFPLLKRHDIKFYKRLLIIVTSPGLILSIAFYIENRYLPGELIYIAVSSAF